MDAELPEMPDVGDKAIRGAYSVQRTEPDSVSPVGHSTSSTSLAAHGSRIRQGPHPRSSRRLIRLGEAKIVPSTKTTHAYSFIREVLLRWGVPLVMTINGGSEFKGVARQLLYALRVTVIKISV